MTRTRPSALPERITALPRRARGFTGRDAELALLGAELSREGDARVWILHGPEGVGTSALAREVAARARDRGVAVAWIDCADDIVRLLQWRKAVKGIGHTSGAASLAAARQWGAQAFARAPERWLLVLDDVRDPSAVASLIPRGGRGTVILTTREDPTAWRFGTEAEPLELAVAAVPIGALSLEESARWLAAGLGPKAHGAALEGARRAAGVPLALRWVEDRARRLKEGLPRALKVLDTYGPGDPVGDAMELAVRGAVRVPGTWGLLAWCSALAEAPVPEVMLATFARLAYPSVETFVAARRALVRRRLVEETPRGLRVHPAVRARVRADLDEDLWLSCGMLGFEGIGEMLSAPSLRGGAAFEVVLAHLVAWASNAERYGAAGDMATTFLHAPADWLEQNELTREALALYAAALPALERIEAAHLAPEARGFASAETLRGYARCAAKEGLRDEALATFARALARESEGGGERGLGVAETLRDLARAHDAAGVRDEADACLERAWALASEHGEAGRALAVDAARLRADRAGKERDADAELTWLRHAIARAEGGGDATRASADLRVRLPRLLVSLHRVDEAQREGERAVAATRVAWGAKSLKVAHALWSLGDAHAARGDHAAAARVYADAVTRHAKSSDGIAREQGTLLWLAARNFEASGEVAEAQAFYDAAATVYARVRSETHPVAVLCRLGEARMLRAQGNARDALAAWERALRHVSEVEALDRDDAGAAGNAMLERARLARALGAPREALPWLDRADKLLFDLTPGGTEEPSRQAVYATLTAHVALERAAVLRDLGDAARALDAIVEGLEAVAGDLDANDAPVLALRRALGERTDAAAD